MPYLPPEPVEPEPETAQVIDLDEARKNRAENDGGDMLDATITDMDGTSRTLREWLRLASF